MQNLKKKKKKKTRIETIKKAGLREMTLPLKIVKFFPLFRKPCHRDKRSKAALV
jgi:hypothetical protein